MVFFKAYIKGYLPLISFIISPFVYSQELKLVLPVGHTHYIGEAQFSFDGTKIVTVSSDNTAKIWDVATGKLLRNLTGHTEPVYFAQFSPDEKRIVTSGADNITKVWDIASGKVVNNLVGHFARFSLDGSKIVTSCDDSTVKIWHSVTGKLLVNIKGYNSYFYSVEFNPDGKSIITSSPDSTAKIWNAVSGKLMLNLKGHDSPVINAKFSPDHKRVITATISGVIRIWDQATGKLHKVINAHSDYITSLELNSDCTKMLSASHDSTAKIWDVESGKLIVQLKRKGSLSPKEIIKQQMGVDTIKDMWKNSRIKPPNELYSHDEQITSAYFAPDGKKILTASFDNKVTIWDALTGESIKHLSIQHVHNAYFDPTGQKILTISSDLTGKIWDTDSGELLSELKGSMSKIYSADFNPEGNKIVTKSDFSALSIWDVLSGKPQRYLKRTSYSFLAKLSSDWKKILTDFKGLSAIRDITTGAILESLPGSCEGLFPTGFLPMAQFSANDEYVAVTCKDSTTQIWDSQTGKLLFNLKSHKSWISTINFSPDGKKFLTGGAYDSTVNIWDLNTGTLINNLRFTTNVNSAQFHPDGKRIVVTYWDLTGNVLDVESGKLLVSLTEDFPTIVSASYSNDGQKIVTSCSDNTGRVWDANSGKLLIRLKENDSPINSAKFNQDNKKIITASNDGFAKVWDAETGNFIFAISQVDEFDYISQVSNGYYQATPAVTKLLHYVDNDLRIISFQQLDIKYNRPDKVLEALGNKDTSLIQSLRNAYLNRISRLKIDTTQFNDDFTFPECAILKKSLSNTDGSLKLQINAKSKAYLNRFNLWINEVPLFGLNGISLEHRRKKDFDTTITINLCSGSNRIEASVFDETSAESYRSPLVVSHMPSLPVKEKLYYIGIGVNEYKNHPCRNLSFATKDIRDLDTLFTADVREYSFLFLDSNATRDKILKIREELMKTNINDKVIIALSGHGILHNKKNFYFGTYDIDFTKPNERGLKFEDLDSLLNDIPARKKLILIDACHSGEIDTSISGKNIQDITTIAECPTDSTKRGDPEMGLKPSVGLDNSFDLAKELFADLARGNGAVVISAARGLGFAEENQTWSNGAFTLCIKAAFQSNYQFPELGETADKNHDGVSVNELKEYILNKVPLLTNDRQKPTMRRQNIEVDWKF